MPREPMWVITDSKHRVEALVVVQGGSAGFWQAIPGLEEKKTEREGKIKYLLRELKKK